MHAAALGNRLEIVKMLVDKDADVNAQDKVTLAFEALCDALCDFETMFLMNGVSFACCFCWCCTDACPTLPLVYVLPPFSHSFPPFVADGCDSFGDCQEQRLS